MHVSPRTVRVPVLVSVMIVMIMVIGHGAVVRHCVIRSQWMGVRYVISLYKSLFRCCSWIMTEAPSMTDDRPTQLSEMFRFMGEPGRLRITGVPRQSTSVSNVAIRTQL